MSEHTIVGNAPSQQKLEIPPKDDDLVLDVDHPAIEEEGDGPTKP